LFGLENRPMTFKEVIGLDVIKKILVSNLKTKKYARGYIFEGSYSSGKTTLSRIFARSILCENPQEDYSPCNVCESCKSFLAGIHPCYLEIDAANNGTKDKIQEIRELFRFDSIIGGDKRIILFDEAHNISKEGKDALLLQLEQEKSNVILIFCTTESHKMPETIKSRCYVFRLPEPSEKNILHKLKFICERNNIEYEEDALYKIVLSSGRHYRDAENKLSMVISIYDKVKVENVEEVFSLYDKEIVKLLLYLSNNLSGIIEISYSLMLKMDVKDIYESIIRILNDAIKVSMGITFNSSDYNKMLKDLFNFYGDVLYNILDYFLSKKIIDINFLQAYLYVLHFKFLRGDFKNEINKNVKEKEKKQEQEQVNVNINKKEDLNTIMEKLEPWERDIVIREMKNLKENNNKVNIELEERISTIWKTNVKDNIQNLEINSIEITPEIFKNILEGGTKNFGKY
jgi:DNA polymerase-3 subunit gamma/tau